MNINSIMRSLPLVAGVLGKRYGVEVKVGGSKAFTNGKCIQLPALPDTATANQLALIRGYIDHESAHIRHTNFRVFKQCVTPLEKHICNIFEDWRIEKAISKSFPGCRVNLNWLITYHFSKATKLPADKPKLILDYLLLRVRSWDVPTVGKSLALYERALDKQYVGLRVQLDAVLDELQLKAKSTRCCLGYARKIIDLIKDESTQKTSSPKPNKQQEELQKLLAADASDLPEDMMESAAQEISAKVRRSEANEVAVVKERSLLVQAGLDAVLKSSNGMSTRLQALLQAELLKRSFPSRRGKLDPHRLNRMFYNPKIFLRHEKQKGLNTHLHILLDSSGSMRERMDLATSSAYALVKALVHVKGVTSSLTTFPGGPNRKFNTVCPLISPGERPTTKIKVSPTGSTPLGPALWWAMQQDAIRDEDRKIILILTDGMPDDMNRSKRALRRAVALGFEIYAIGIQSDHVRLLLPNQHRVINHLGELSPALFHLLQNKLLKGGTNGCLY